MVKKHKVVAGIEEDDALRARKRVRNRASPIGFVKLYEFISEDQGNAVAEMELESLLDIKCHCLNNKLITCTPLTSRVYEIFKDITESGVPFKQLLYVDSLDVSALDLELLEGHFAANIWSKENIDKVLLADLQIDGESYGKLELKSQFGIDYTLFGGAMGFTKWVDTCADPSCSNKFGDFAAGIIAGGASSSAAAARVTRATRSRSNSSLSPRTAAGKSPILPPDNDYLGDDTGSDESSEDDVDKYLIVTRKQKGSRGVKRVGGVDNIVPRSASVATEVISSHKSPDAPASVKLDGKLVTKVSLHSDDINIQAGMRHSIASSEDNAVVKDRNDGLNVSASGESAELVEAVGVNKSIAKDSAIIPEAVGVNKSIANDAAIIPEAVGVNKSISKDSAIIPEISVAMDVDEASKVSDSIAIPQAPDAQGSKLSVSADVVEAPVLHVYKSAKGKGKLHTLRQKDSQIRAIVCNELDITAEMAAFGATDKLNDAKKASPRRKHIPKGNSNILKKQATSLSPEVSPSRVQEADSNDAFSPRGDDSGSVFVPIATIVASPLSSPGPATDPEEASIPDASTLPEAAPSVDTGIRAAPMVCNIQAAAAHSDVQPHVDKEGNLLVPASSLFNNVVADVSTDVPSRKDSPKNVVDVEVNEQTNDIPYTKSPGVFVSARMLFPDIEPPLWNFTN
ncbi:hypothetical protein ACQ4PT_011811 [Festuca glaucescens]